MSTRIFRECLLSELSREVWANTPWIVDTKFGGFGPEGELHSIRKWCTLLFGPEAWPIHHRQANWHVGGACVYGWGWIGFHTKEMAEQFIDAFPSLTKPLEL